MIALMGVEDQICQWEWIEWGGVWWGGVWWGGVGWGDLMCHGGGENWCYRYRNSSCRPWKDAPEERSLNDTPGLSFYIIQRLSPSVPFKVAAHATSHLYVGHQDISEPKCQLLLGFRTMQVKETERERGSESRERFSHNTPQMCLIPK